MVYYNNKALAQQQGYLVANPAYSDPTLSEFGSLSVDLAPSQNTVQWDMIIGQGAKVKKADGLAFPESGAVKSEPFTNKSKYFNSILILPELDYKAFLAGDETAVAKVASMQSDIMFQMAEDMIAWFTGYGTTWTSDPDYDIDWKPWLTIAAADTDGTMEVPIPFTELVVPDTGSATTPNLAIAMGTVLTGTAQTVDFANITFGPFIDAALRVKDVKNGRRLCKSQSKTDLSGDTFIVFMNPRTITRLKRQHPRVQSTTGVIYDMSTTIYAEIEGLGFKIKPLSSLAFSNAEDGVCTFIVVVNPKDNFKIGIAEGLTVEGFEIESKNGNKQAVQRYHQRGVPFTQPYVMEVTAGTVNYFKACAFGSFVFVNNA